MKKIQAVCVYCSASDRLDPIYKEAADYLGTRLAQEDIKLVFGGGRVGLMGILADAVIKNGGRAIGFIPHYLEEYEGSHNGIQELHIVDSMHTRKSKMAENSDAFIILPGGFGTLDELFEILTWRQLDLHTKPIIIVNINNYWDPLISLMHNVVEHNFARLTDIQLVNVVSSVDEAIQLLLDLEPTETKFKKHKA
jgi:uncharacterized protein (TIGR00730 family)